MVYCGKQGKQEWELGLTQPLSTEVDSMDTSFSLEIFDQEDVVVGTVRGKLLTLCLYGGRYMYPGLKLQAYTTGRGGRPEKAGFVYL